MMTFYVYSFAEVIFLALLSAVWLGLVVYILRRMGKMAKVGFTVNISIEPVVPPAVPLSVVADPMNLVGTVDQPFAAALSDNVKGGVAPVSFSVAGTMPDGLSVDSQGSITGTPTTPGTSTLSVTASDSGA